MKVRQGTRLIGRCGCTTTQVNSEIVTPFRYLFFVVGIEKMYVEYAKSKWILFSFILLIIKGTELVINIVRTYLNRVNLKQQ